MILLRPPRLLKLATNNKARTSAIDDPGDRAFRLREFERTQLEFTQGLTLYLMSPQLATHHE